MDRQTALERIQRVNKEREALIDIRGDQYATPADTLVTFSRAALICQGQGIILTPGQVAKVLMAVKLARLAEDPVHWDSVLDGHNYLDLAYLCDLESEQSVYGADASSSPSR